MNLNFSNNGFFCVLYFCYTNVTPSPLVRFSDSDEIKKNEAPKAFLKNKAPVTLFN